MVIIVHVQVHVLKYNRCYLKGVENVENTEKLAILSLNVVTVSHINTDNIIVKEVP